MCVCCTALDLLLLVTEMPVKSLILIVATALFWLGNLAGRRHGVVLGRSLLASHGDHAMSSATVSDAAKAPRHVTHWAGYETAEGKYYGTVARINAWSLKLKPGQFSSSVVWLSSDGGNHQIMAGFRTSPDTYNDTDLHFFVSWTADGFNSTGCIDTSCKGFVASSTPPARSQLSPGSTVAQPSVYHGNQTDYTIAIEKDARTWSLYVDVSGRQEPIGYFPASLFTGGLADHADRVGWGGSARSLDGGGASSPSPPMGSGRGPREEFGGSAYIGSIGVVDGSGKSSAPAAANVTSLADACYQASVFGVTPDDGAFFYYGGHGGCHH